MEKKYVHFAEYLGQALGKTSLCRVPVTWHSAKNDAVNCVALVCRVSSFAERPTLGKEYFAECFSLPSAWRSAKDAFTMCFSLPSVTLGKESLCRVPDI
jgi:hypothetical protein